MFGLFPSGPRTQHVVVAVVYDPERKKFLVVFNPRWGRYTFPTRHKSREDAYDPLREREIAVRDARAALREDLGAALDVPAGVEIEAHWMDRIAARGESGRTRRQTRYVYDIVTLVLPRPLPEGDFAGFYGWLSADEIRDSDPDEPGPNARAVSFTTWQALTKLLDNQHAAIAVVSRDVDGRREYLMTRSRNGRWFFPASRMGDLVPAERLVVYEFKMKADYPGRIAVGEGEEEVELEQQTHHLGPRTYVFHLRKAGFPQEDLTLPGSRLEQALDRAGVEFGWLDDAHLSAGGPEISDTATRLMPAVRRLG